MEINSLKNRLEEIQRNQEIFKIENISNVGEESSRTNEILDHQRRGRPYEDNELVLGFQKDVNLLMSELMKEEPHRCVVSIMGMGGLGKTTIARKLYNINSLRDKFNFSGWVSVSKDYNIGDLLRRTIKSFKKSTTKEEFEMLEKMKKEDLESYLRNLLNEGRYIVVLDDVWDVRLWESLRGAFPDNKNGSNLQALQTLEMGGSVGSPISLPDEICKAKQLRHLVGVFKWPFRVDNLINLRTLTHVVVEGLMEFNPMDLINLRDLSVFVMEQSNRFTLDSIGRLRSLQFFGLFVGDKESPLFPPLRPLSHCQHLLELTLWNEYGLGWKLPTELHEFLSNLKYLHLAALNKPEDPMPTLEKLPNLTFLDLQFYGGDKLACSAGGFPQLQFLRIYGGHVKELQVEEGGLPLLKGLNVKDSVRMPERLRSIPTIPWIND
ncbi:uncharacterized protein LOC130787027 [Actinidia eriantha]|uniref:uncharacterized protein LOC130787027 n=1 Tax=Actinidia eriantha TaxID=165200 RepID=UPI0025876B60|nr:uncharacterized protein LOC130787027 [Actinidia eriantha]